MLLRKRTEVDCSMLRLWFYNSISFKISFDFFNSSPDKVTPLPIFSCSRAQSLKSCLGALSFQLIRFNSFVQPLEYFESIPIVSFISYLMFGMFQTPLYSYSNKTIYYSHIPNHLIHLVYSSNLEEIYPYKP